MGAVPSRAQRPFWVHQFAEYLMGLVLVSVVFQDSEPLVPAFAGLLVILNASLARGPLGAFNAVSRSTHRVLDLVVMFGLLGAALQPWIPETATGRLLLVVVLIPYSFSWFYTNWAERSQMKRKRVARGSDTSATVGRTAGRLAGRGWSKVRNLDNPDNQRG